MNIQKTIQYTAVTAAFVVAPLLTYGSALLLDSQSENTVKTPSNFVKAPIEKTEELSPEVVSQISRSIALIDKS